MAVGVDGWGDRVRETRKINGGEERATENNNGKGGAWILDTWMQLTIRGVRVLTV